MDSSVIASEARQSGAPGLPPVASPARRAWARLLRRRGAMLGLLIVLLFIAAALCASWIAPFDPVATSWSDAGADGVWIEVLSIQSCNAQPP